MADFNPYTDFKLDPGVFGGSSFESSWKPDSDSWNKAFNSKTNYSKESQAALNILNAKYPNPNSMTMTNKGGKKRRNKSKRNRNKSKRNKNKSKRRNRKKSKRSRK